MAAGMRVYVYVSTAVYGLESSKADSERRVGLRDAPGSTVGPGLR